MKITDIPGMGDYGVFIDGVDFNTLDEETWMRIGDLHMSKLVTIIRDCNLSWENQIDWIEKFGASRNNFSYNMLTKYDEKDWSLLVKKVLQGDTSIDEQDRKDIKTAYGVSELRKDGRHVARVSGKKDKDGNPYGLFAEGELTWHSNESSQLTFTPGVSLLGAEGVVGSSTGFVTTANYYQDISEEFRSELEEMIIVHKFQPGVMNPGLREEQDSVVRNNMCPFDNSEVPMVIKSPDGIKGLHYPVNTAWKIKGLSKEESDKIFKRINDELFTEKYVYDHWYQNNGDFLLFDNSITLHRRLGNTDNRLCYRIQHDYSNLQETPWQPYFQKEFQDKYVEDITNIVDKMGYKDFKLPKVA